MMSFGPAVGVHFRNDFVIEASPSPVLDLVQIPVMAYLQIFVPLLFVIFWFLILAGLITLPVSSARGWFLAQSSRLTIANLLERVRALEKHALRHDWSAALYIILLGSPLVAILAILYGHHPLSLSGYDSPFQAFATNYGFLFFFIPFAGVTMSGVSLIAALFFPVLILTVLFWVVLFRCYWAILRHGTSIAIRWQMLALGIFTAVQPFAFRLLRDSILPAIGFTGNASPIMGYNATYVLAFAFPCLLYVILAMVLQRRLRHPLPTGFSGVYLGLLYLAILAADLH